MNNIRNRFGDSKNHLMLIGFIGILITTIIIIWGLKFPNNVTLNVYTDFTDINNDWTQVLSNEEIYLSDINDFTKENASKQIIIEKTIDMQTEGRYLLFKTKNQEVYVSVDDECIYSFEIPTNYEYLMTPGDSWHTISLEEFSQGKTLRIELATSFEKYQILPSDIYFLNSGELQIVQAYNIWFCNTVAIFMIILAVLSYANAFFWKKQMVKLYSLALGHLYMFISLWLLTEINVIKILTQSSMASYMLTMFFVRVLPIVFFYLSETTIRKQTWWLKAFEYCAIINLVATFVLQFTLHISLLDTLFITYLLILIGSVVTIINMAYNFGLSHKKREKLTHVDLLYYSRIFLVLGSLFEVFIYFNFAKYSDFVGIPISIAMIFHTILTRIILIRLETEIEGEMIELERENQKLQILPLMQQINAHFLFNILNSISALCKIDSSRADDAVILLSQYMREYMYLVNSYEVITFAHELKLMKAYLMIQKIRFEDLKFEFNIKYEDFSIPPLCVQPLVENAIIHGLKKEGSKVCISTKREGRFIVVSVVDDGSGFDVNSIQEQTSIGLGNVRARIEIYGGKLEINSGWLGTSATIYIPENLEKIEEITDEADLCR